jgi:hypothetical protein
VALERVERKTDRDGVHLHADEQSTPI